METLKKHFSLIILGLISSFLLNSVKAQNNELLALEPNQLSVLEPLNDKTEEIEDAYQRPMKLRDLISIDDKFPVEEDKTINVHSNLNEVDLFLILNELESIEVELWSEDKLLLIAKECRFGDEFMSECIEELEEGYSLVLKSKNKVTIFR